MLLFTACGEKGGDSEEAKVSSQRADSLSRKLNAPELKAVSAEILENPSDAALYHKRAKVYMSLQEPEEAANDAMRAIRLDSTNASYYMTLVDVYYSQNNTRLARELLEITVRKFPDHIDALLKLAELHWLVRQYQKGIDYVNRALKADPHLARAYYIKGSIYRESGDTSRALSSLETATEQDNTFADAYHDIGVIYAARKNPVAIEYYDNVLRIQPENPETRYARARLLQDLGRDDEAITEYKKLADSKKDCAECHYNLGAIYLEIKKDYPAALEHFSRAIEILPDYAQAYFARGYTHARMKNRKRAEEDYRACLRLSPNYEPAVQGLNEL